MRLQLTTHEYMWIGNGPMLTHEHPIGYKIDLPGGCKAYVNDFCGCAGAEDWRIRIEQPNGTSSRWFHHHDNFYAALAVVRGYVIEHFK
jgi:hypothetical protein